MKGYTDIFNSDISTVDEVCKDDDSVQIAPPAKLLGSAIADGRYNGVLDGEASLLHGVYDNDSSLSVDPLCDFNSDLSSLNMKPSIPVSVDKSE